MAEKAVKPRRKERTDELSFEIPLVLSADLNYVFPAFVVMAGVLQNADSDTFYHFYILTYDEIEAAVNPLEKELRKHHTAFTIKIVPIDRQEFYGIKLTSSHITMATYSRLFIADLITGWDKCIYLDSDLLINGNLRELFEYKLQGNYLLGVRDPDIVTNDRHDSSHRDSLGLPSLQNYINAGVLVMDLAMLRRDRINERFKRQMQIESIYEDQDVLNVCCYGKIGLLPQKYNLFHSYYEETMIFLHEYVAPAELEFAPDQPAILHFVDQYKPWRNLHCKGAKGWWELAAIFSQQTVFREYYQNSRNETEKWDIRYLLQQCRQKKHVAVWGMTGHGKEAIGLLRRNGITNISFVCDNNLAAGVGYFEGIRVIESAAVDLPVQDIFWVLSCQTAFKQVKEQLLLMGVSADHIAQYLYRKPLTFYRSLASDYYVDELHQIMIREYGLTREAEAYDRIIWAEERDALSKQEYERLSFRYMFDEWLKVIAL